MAYLSRFKIQQACYQLEAGNVIAYPTEAVYGLGCDPLQESAVLRLLALKQRPVEKGLILIAANFEQLAPYLIYDEEIFKKVHSTGTDAVTWVIPCQSWVPKWITGNHHSLAVRVTKHPLSKALCKYFDAPIVSTSANPSNKQPAVTALQVRNYFSRQKIHLLAGTTGGNKMPSTIYDAVTRLQLR